MRKTIAVIILLLSVATLNACAQGKLGPRVYFGNVKNSEREPKYSIKEILADPLLHINKLEYEVKSYTVIIMLAGSDDVLGPYNIKGATLSAEVQDVLRTKAGREGILSFESIRAMGGDGQLRVMNPVRVRYVR